MCAVDKKINIMCGLQLIILVIAVLIPGLLAVCEFPEFLRNPLPGGEERYWLTETRFHNTKAHWEKRLKITVRAHEIVTMVSQEGKCRGQGHETSPVTCERNELKFKLTCEEEKDGKFIVRKHGQQTGGDSYMCYNFKKRNKNVVQIWRSKNTANTGILCKSYTMVRDEWLWVAPKLEEWVACPLQGGYDFSTYTVYQHDYYYDQEEAYCEDSLLPSRLESECIRGEGLQFIFPRSDCSPFSDHMLFVQLYCWAYWTEDDKTFVVLSEAHVTPQFVLRYTGQPDPQLEMTAFLYFSPVIPLASNGLLSDGVADTLSMVKMMIKPSDPGDGVCYDESSECTKADSHNKCTSSDIFHLNYCKKTCGLCRLLPSSNTECHFPQEAMGNWLYFIQGQQETVSVNDGNMSFSTLGNFICKGVNSPDHDFSRQYKVLSYYNNGCRPRYSCIELWQNTEQVFQFRLSPSQPKDESFRLCRFKEDPGPIYGEIRSHKKKNLLPAHLTVLDSCALYGEIPVAKENTNNKCYGTLSDFNNLQCRLDETLRLKLNGPCDLYGGYSSVYRELTCLAFSSVQEDYSLLFTREIANNNQFSCWIVRTYAERMNYRPWRFMHQLNTTDCNSVDLYTSMPMEKSLLDLKIMNGNRKQICDSPQGSDSKTQNPKHSERSQPSYEGKRKQGSVSDLPLQTDCETQSPVYSVNPRNPTINYLPVHGAATGQHRMCTLQLVLFYLTLIVLQFYTLKVR